jgi:hypothetical protein
MEQDLKTKFENYKKEQMLQAEKELMELLRKHDVRITTRQVYTDGIPGPISILLVPNT